MASVTQELGYLPSQELGYLPTASEVTTEGGIEMRLLLLLLLLMAGTNLYCLVNRGTLCVNNLPRVVT